VNAGSIADIKLEGSKRFPLKPNNKGSPQRNKKNWGAGNQLRLPSDGDGSRWLHKYQEEVSKQCFGHEERWMWGLAYGDNLHREKGK